METTIKGVEFPKIRGTFLGVPIFFGLHRGNLGKYHAMLTRNSNG